MRFIYLYIFLSSLHILQAQETTIFAPLGATWYYSTWVQVPPPGLFTFVSDGDTLLNGVNARILRFYNAEEGELQPVDSLNKYVYTSGNKVYYWVNDGFYLLYDFNAQPGDTIHSRVEDFPISLSCGSDFSEGPFDFSYVIDSVGSRIQNGQILRSQYVHPIYPEVDLTWIMENPIVERFGQFSSASFWWGRGQGCALGGFPGELRCYEDQDIYFKNPYTMFNLECDYVSAVKSISESIKPVYPNPANDFITIPDNAEIINIYNSTGQRIRVYNNQDQIDVNNLLPDIYFIQYQINDTWYIEKFIKI